MKQYISPEMEITPFESSDVITTSTVDNMSSQNQGPWEGLGIDN